MLSGYRQNGYTQECYVQMLYDVGDYFQAKQSQ